jgi:hypothetical protein
MNYTHPPVRNDPPHSYQTTVASIHQQFHEELHHRYLDGSNLSRETLDEYDDDVIRRDQVDPWRNVHPKDVHIGSANASTRCRGRRNEHCWMSVYEKQSAFNALALSSEPGNLQNNEICGSQQKGVSQ